MVFLILFMCYCWYTHKMKNRPRRQNAVSPPVADIQLTNMYPPSFEEAIRMAEESARRRRRRRHRTSDTAASADRDVGTQRDNSADSATGDSSNDGENVTQRTQDSGVPSNLGDSGVVTGDRDLTVGQSDSAGVSGVDSGSVQDAVDNVDNVSVASTYKTASRGGSFRAPSPWLNLISYLNK